MEINDKYYEDVSIKNSIHYDEIIKAQDIVKKYIMREKRIVVGGMSIDFALKLRGNKGIYDDNALPDYDFYSHQHHTDAYEIGMWLYSKGFRGISIINALHPSTMKVRVNFNVIADITYVPKYILDKIPTLHYRGFVIIHPHVQMIDQHRALCFPYENAPLETIKGARPMKDMKRYDLLYEQYPIKASPISVELKEYTIPKEILHNQCITGFFALNYWVSEAKKMGFKSNLDFGTIMFMKDVIKYSLPVDSHGISLYSDNISEVFSLIKNVYKPNKERFYQRFLDKLPRKIILDNRWELLENNQKIAAHREIDSIYISNLQNIMMYLLINYVLLAKIKNIDRGGSFYSAYLQCRDLVSWASKKYYSATSNEKKEMFAKFLPSATTYGERNLSDSSVVQRHNFGLKNKEDPVPIGVKYYQPWHVYDQDLESGRIEKNKYLFFTGKSEVFNIAGEECDNFLSK